MNNCSVGVYKYLYMNIYIYIYKNAMYLQMYIHRTHNNKQVQTFTMRSRIFTTVSSLVTG